MPVSIRSPIASARRRSRLQTKATKPCSVSLAISTASSSVANVITGATGRLGRHVISSLLRLDVQLPDLVAAGRDEEKLGALRELGLATVRADYTEPATLDEAFAGADTVLLISSSEVGIRVPQHRNAVDAAVRAGVYVRNQAPIRLGPPDLG